jgi:hypothetical protein
MLELIGVLEADFDGVIIKVFVFKFYFDSPQESLKEKINLN